MSCHAPTNMRALVEYKKSKEIKRTKANLKSAMTFPFGENNLRWKIKKNPEE